MSCGRVPCIDVDAFLVDNPTCVDGCLVNPCKCGQMPCFIGVECYSASPFDASWSKKSSKLHDQSGGTLDAAHCEGDIGQVNTARAGQKRAKSFFGVKTKRSCCGFQLYVDRFLVSAGGKEPLAVENYPVSPSNMDRFLVQRGKCGRMPCKSRVSSCPGHSSGCFRPSKPVLEVKCGRIPCVSGAYRTLNMDRCRDGNPRNHWAKPQLWTDSLYPEGRQPQMWTDAVSSHHRSLLNMDKWLEK